MERLTREKTITVRGIEKAVCNHENDDCNDNCMYGRCRWQEKANMLLKEYEDTGLLPAEIMGKMEALRIYKEQGITPDQITELKERDTAKAPEEFDGYWHKCPRCGKYVGGLKGNFCHVCGQRLKWEE